MSIKAYQQAGAVSDPGTDIKGKQSAEKHTFALVVHALFANQTLNVINDNSFFS